MTRPLENDLRRIRRMVADQKYQKAVSACEQLLRFEPRSAQALELLGSALVASGRLAEGVTRLQHAVTVEPSRKDGWLALGDVFLRCGQPRDATSVFSTALTRFPSDFELLYGLARAQQSGGETPLAIESYRRCLSLNPDSPEALNNLGTLLEQTGELTEAIECLSRALELKPGYVRALNNLGKSLRRAHRPAEAVTSLEKALTLSPDNPITLTNLGLALTDLGRQQEALRQLRRAIGIQPQLAEAHHGLAQASLASGDFPGAIDALQRALTIKPDFVDAGLLLARNLISSGQYPRALHYLEQVARAKPDCAEAYHCAGVVLYSLGRIAQARDNFEQALRYDPNYFEAQLWKGRALVLLKQLPEAVAWLANVAPLRPDDARPPVEMLYCHLKMCDWSGVRRTVQQLEQMPEGLERVPPFILLAVSDDPAAQLLSAQLISRGTPGNRKELARAPVYQHDRIRVAYVSCDYYVHATTWLIAELFELHDRSTFEILAVSFGAPDQSPVRRRIEQACDVFFDAAGLSDEEIARWMREHEVDIAIDLKGYTAFARAGIFACRPAPIQVSYLGYPGTMGAPFMDYLIADRCVIPESEQKHYGEQIAYLPHCYQVNDRKRTAADTALDRASAGLPPHGFVFCSFNNNWKITAEIFDVWMRLLDAVPDSVLWLLEDNTWAVANLRAAAGERGVSPERLVFCPRVLPAEHLARHRLADLFLDTFPVNAHTTASDALWMGLPVLTLAGRAFPGRVAASLLNAVGLGGLVTGSLAEYEQKALELVRDPQQLRALRAQLNANRDTTPLFDSPSYCRHLESAYKQMWARHRQGLAPESFQVDPQGFPIDLRAGK